MVDGGSGVGHCADGGSYGGGDMVGGMRTFHISDLLSVTTGRLVSSRHNMHTHINPVEEAQAMVGDDCVIIVETGVGE